MMIKTFITTSIRKMQKKNNLSKFDHWESSRAQNNCNLGFKMCLKGKNPKIALEERVARKFFQPKMFLKLT